MRERWGGAAVRWTVLVCATVLAWRAFATLGLAAPDLFAALLVALVLAVAGAGPPRPHRWLSMVAQGILAVTIGLSVQRATLAAVGSHGVAVLVVAVATLGLSVLAGLALALRRDVDPVTGVLGSIAGGATGLVAVAGELGADERIVVVAQYLRVALVVLTMPLVVTYVFAARAAPGREVADPAGAAPWWAGLLVLAGAVVAGTGVATALRIPIPATLGPLALSAGAELLGWIGGVAVPAAVLPVAFLIIGWQAGAAFTRGSVPALGRIFGWLLLLMLVLIAACGGLGLLLARWTGVSVLQGYLATTPGGLAAVLAVAGSSDADATFVAACQVLRLVLMLVAAPAIVAVVRRWTSRRAAARAATER